jgi:DNA-binding GntR family transcriptional regulator
VNLPRVSAALIAESLRDAVERGDYQPGARLPSILRLSEAYGTSLGTALRALRLLADAGHAVHVAGKGWFTPG